MQDGDQGIKEQGDSPLQDYTPGLWANKCLCGRLCSFTAMHHAEASQQDGNTEVLLALSLGSL